MRPASYNQHGRWWRKFSCFVPSIGILVHTSRCQRPLPLFWGGGSGRKAGGNSVSLVTHVPVSVSMRAMAELSITVSSEQQGESWGLVRATRYG